MFPTAIIFHINKLISEVRLNHSDVVSRKYFKHVKVTCDLRSFPDGQNVVFPECRRFRRQKSKNWEKNYFQGEKRFSKKHSDCLLKPFGFSFRRDRTQFRPFHNRISY